MGILTPKPAMSTKSPKKIQKRFAQVAIKLIHSPEVSSKMVAALKAGAANPAQTVAELALGILERMKKDVKGLNPDLVFSVSGIVIVFILELASVSKAFEVDDGMLKQSVAALAALVKQTKQPAAVPMAPPPPPSGIMNQHATVQ